MRREACGAHVDGRGPADGAAACRIRFEPPLVVDGVVGTVERMDINLDPRHASFDALGDGGEGVAGVVAGIDGGVADERGCAAEAIRVVRSGHGLIVTAWERGRPSIRASFVDRY